MINKRKVKLAVISDVHLGTYGCHAKELKHYLETISPEILILNGDIIDIWQFSKNYWPKSHMKVIRQILKLSENLIIIFLSYVVFLRVKTTLKILPNSYFQIKVE